MKNLILFTLLFAASIAGAQTTESTFLRDTDSTFVETITTTDAQGRTVSQVYEYYTNADFVLLAVATFSSAKIEAERKEREALDLTRDANQLRLFVVDSLSENFDSLEADILLQSLTNFTQLREVVGGNVTTLDYTIEANVNNPATLRLRSTTGGVRVGIIIPIHFEKFLLRNFYDGEDVEMLFRQTANGADVFTGRNAAGDRITLIR